VWALVETGLLEIPERLLMAVAQGVTDEEPPDTIDREAL
jgi:DNA helicase-2/ATP-dependent DNA helicase PcrA